MAVSIPHVPTPAASPTADDAPARESAALTRDLAEVMDACNAVTRKLQASHERLQAEVVRLRRELASADAQLQRSRRLAALGEMAAGIAHEVRNPLAAIQLFAGLIENDLSGTAEADPAADDTPCDRALRNTRRIAEAVRGLDAVVGDVLSFARPMTPRVTPIDPLEVLRAAVDSVRADAAAAGAEVTLASGGAHGSALEADATLIRQAVINLLRNAVQAVDGRPERRVVVGLASRGSDVTIEVTDTGPGIGDADIDRLFNPFFTTRSTGTGLGLAIVHRIADAHGGSVTVWNRPGGGAAFRISLPRRSARPADPPRVDDGSARPLTGRGAA